MTVSLPEGFGVPQSAVFVGDCLTLIPKLPDDCIDVVVTSPPYWGHRLSLGNGTEADPRDYISILESVFLAIKPKLKRNGIVWLNLGDAYNTPINWGVADHKYSSLGPDRNGFSPENAAYTKPRFRRKAFVDKEFGWLQYGNLLMLPQRLLIALVESGYLYRGEIIWAKRTRCLKVAADAHTASTNRSTCWPKTNNIPSARRLLYQLYGHSRTRVSTGCNIVPDFR